ncbi:MAG: DMT family transporter [Flavobacteriales bacterium]
MQNKLAGIGLLVILGAVWGSSFTLMKLGMEPVDEFHTLNHFQVAGLRMAIAALVMLPFAIRSIKLLKTKSAPYLLIVGLCGNFIPSYLFTYAGTGLSSGFCGILNSFTPIFTVIIALIAFKTKVHWLQGIGILIGTVGIISLITSGGQITLVNSPSHIGAILIATLLYGISVNTIRHKLNHISPLEVTALGLFCILPFAVGSFIFEGTVKDIAYKPYGWSALGYVIILGVVGTAISNIYFNRLIKLTSAIFASSVTYLIPIFAVLFGYILKESITYMQFISMLVLLSGVFLVNFHELLLKGLGKKKQ